MPSKTIPISPSQALLLLINHYKNDLTKADELKKLYLSGAASPDDAARIKLLLNDTALAPYEVIVNDTTINNDPTRRYFETQLAYESLAQGLQRIDISELGSQVQNQYAQLPLAKQTVAQEIFSGQTKTKGSNLAEEYSDYIKKIESKTIFSKLSDLDREKISLLVKSAYLGTVRASGRAPLPLDIYARGIYSEKNKGKILNSEQATTRNQHLGLMKGHMPLALDDVAYAEQVVPYLKPSDQATFASDAQWVRENFDKLVHPFSNSISGTMLSQLRVQAGFMHNDEGIFTQSSEKMSLFCQLFASAMLFNSGGHTLHEFTAPLTLDAVRAEFSSIPGFDKINLESMYLKGNETAFENALEKAIAYNKMLLIKQQLKDEIIERPQTFKDKLNQLKQNVDEPHNPDHQTLNT